MKHKRIQIHPTAGYLVFAGSALVATALIAADPPKRSTAITRSGGGMRDATSHEKLALAYRQQRQQDPMKALAARSGESNVADPVKENRPKDLVKNSDILCFYGSATLVPKRAVLHIPNNFRNRFEFKQGSKLKSFPEFFASNRGWIQTVEVTRAQAEGKEPLAEAKVEMIEKSSKVIVATFKGGPISVLPQKAPEELEKETQAK